jgi:predicted nucleic acid-binding Zn ribbon protein
MYTKVWFLKMQLIMRKEKNEMNMKEALQYFLQKMNLKPGMYENQIVTIWKELMGATIESYTREIKLRGNKLYLRIDSAPLRAELTLSREKLKKRLNEQLGEDYISDVIIR